MTTSIPTQMSAPTLAPPPRRLPPDITALNSFLGMLGSYAPDWIFGMGAEPLYHYTDLGGLLGILSNHDFWLTHSRFLNDEQELTHGYSLARRVLSRLQAEMTNDDWPAYLVRVGELLEQPPSQGVYICCFCKKDNLLSQWRGYGANGSGVSIRLKPAEFGSVTGPDSPHNGLMRLWKILYNPQRQENIIDAALRSAYTSAPDTEQRAARAADAIEFFIPTFKNADFTEEDECRLIFSPPENCPVKPLFRIARGMLVPYYSLKALSGSRQLPIDAVTVGPSANKAMNVESVRMMLTANGYADVNVMASATPFRA